MPKRTETTITAQFSLYPLGVTENRPAIDAAVAAVNATGMSVRVDRMSSFIEGNEHDVFAALRAAFMAVAEQGDAILVATVSNAC